MKQLHWFTRRPSAGLRRSLLLLMALIFALSPIAQRPAARAQQIGGSSGPLPPSSAVTLGLVTGAFYDEYNQTLNGYAEQVLNEYKYLGVQWIRIEANRIPASRRWIYRRLVEMAHARGIKVLFLVGGSFYDKNDTSLLDRLYVVSQVVGAENDPAPGSLRYYATRVFGQDYATRPDAYEIGNEPNDCSNDVLCATPGKGFRIGPMTFTLLLLYAWTWKQDEHRPELIVSGGIQNANLNELWWPRFLEEISHYSVRPYDYFGIHPYNPKDVDTTTCINLYRNGCFVAWENQVVPKLIDVRNRVDEATHFLGTRLFVTEIGWQYHAGGDPCPDESKCVVNEDQLREGMQAAVNAATRSNAVDLVLFYNYRDDPLGTSHREYFGLRADWNAALQRWPAKASWNKFRELAQAAMTDPELAWLPVACPAPPPGRSPLEWTGPCRKRFYDTSLQPFDYYVEDLARKGVIEGTPIEGGSPPYQWTFNVGDAISRATFVSWIVRARNWAFVDTTNSQHFIDVSPANRYFEYIETAYAQNPRPFDGYVCNGSDEETDAPDALCFRPNDTLKRGQASKIVTLSWNWTEPVSSQTFEDVPPGSTFYEYIERMARRGLVSGYDCGGPGEPCNPPYNRPYFRPNNTVTRGQISKILSNAIAYIPSDSLDCASCAAPAVKATAARPD